MKRMIIDTDPGVDDAQAIMMALAHPEVQVEALTVVAGNVGLAHTVANAKKILDVFDAQVPVYAGSAHPLVLEAETAAYVHGEDGLGDAGIPASSRETEGEPAAVALVRMANEAPGEISLVAIGPLTNLAVALHLDPQLPEKFKELIIMGGAVDARGNTDNLSAEFNIFTDPEAAHLVFEAWPQLTLVSWEATMAHGIPEHVWGPWRDLPTPRAEFFFRVSDKVINFLAEILGRATMFGADGLAMAVALEPDIVVEAETHYVSVELSGRHTRGQTTVDWMDRSGREPNARIIRQVNHQRFYELMELPLR
jgi:purine nucleosidase